MILFFHGIKKEITIPVNFILDDKKIVVDADFSISLSDYKIKRPSLLTIKMKDEITKHLRDRNYSNQDIFQKWTSCLLIWAACIIPCAGRVGRETNENNLCCIKN